MKESFLSRWYMSSIIFVIIISVLILGKQLLIPVTLALFLSLGLSPLVERFKKWGVHRVVAILATFIIGLSALGVIGFTVGFAVNDFINKVPTYGDEVANNIINTKQLITNHLPISDEELTSLIKNSSSISSWGVTAAGTVLRATTSIAGTFGITIVVTFFTLLYRRRIKKFFEMVADKNRQEEIEIIARKSFKILPRYILGLILVIAIMTVLNTLGFWLIGIPSPLFWGIIVSFLNVIPYVGTILGFGGVVIFALVVAGPATALFAVIMFLIIQFIDNNFLTPTITGGQIAINPLAAIISILAWGMIWGVMGMVLALPILGLIKIICDTIPQLQPFGYLLGDKE